jgi:hypothetical protein
MILAYRLYASTSMRSEETLGYFMSREQAEEELEIVVQKYGDDYREYLHIESIEIK